MYASNKTQKICCKLKKEKTLGREPISMAAFVCQGGLEGLEQELQQLLGEGLSEVNSPVVIPVVVPALPDLSLCSVDQILHAFLRQQETRCMVYSEFERAFITFTTKKDKPAFEAFRHIASAITSQFSLISTNIRTIEAALTKLEVCEPSMAVSMDRSIDSFQLIRSRAWGKIIRKIQEIEREKLELSIQMQSTHCTYLVISVLL